MHCFSYFFLQVLQRLVELQLTFSFRFTGGAVAVDCVSRSEISSRIAAMVLENTFTSIPDMAKVLFSNVKLLARLPQWCHKNKV